MAADVTLISIPDRMHETPDGGMSAKDICGVLCYEQLLPGDELLKDQDGEPYALVPGELRGKFSDWWYSQMRNPDFDVIEVGAWSPGKAYLLGEGYERYMPSSTRAVMEFLAGGRELTPGVRQATMARMSYPDTSIYKYSRGTGSGKRKWRSSRTVARNRRPVAQWLRAHEGDWVIAESW